MLMLQRRFAPLERLIERIEGSTRRAGEPPAPERAAPVRGGRQAVALVQPAAGGIEDERRRSGTLAMRAQEEERKRLARDLHDEVNQALTAILLRLEALSQDARRRASPR